VVAVHAQGVLSQACQGPQDKGTLLGRVMVQQWHS
jgi:hypothetical protein